MIIGPSHAIRWNWHVRDGVVHCDLPPERIVGLGGAPIWSKYLFDRAVAGVGSDRRLAVMVPDFRFGNGICLDEAALNGPLMQSGFLAVDAHAMALEHDRLMYARGLAGLNEWHSRFGKRARYIFWCLLGRQVQDRMLGRHIENGVYRHPVFNYAQTISALPGLDIVDLAPLLRFPMHELSRLYIDSSLHPSQIGYLFLNNTLCQGMDAGMAYRLAVGEVESILLDLAQKALLAKGRKVLLTGRSVWLDTLMRYMGANGLRKLAAAGLVLAPIDSGAGQPHLAELADIVSVTDCAVVVISAGGRDLSQALARAFSTDPMAWRDSPCVDWESATTTVIAARKETPRLVRLDKDLVTSPDSLLPELSADMVEQGPSGMPSWTGIRYLLEFAIQEAAPIVRFGAVGNPPESKGLHK